MKSLYDYYADEKYSLNLNYYEIPQYVFDLDCFRDYGRIFIENYFFYGLKGQLVDNIDQFDGMRSIHSNIVFILGGIIFFKVLGKINDNFITYANEYYPFSYVWYLTSLAHDFGYIMENDGELLDFAQRLEFKEQQAIINNKCINYYGYFINRIINRAAPMKCCKKCENNQLLMLHSDFDDKKRYSKFLGTLYRTYHQKKILNVDGIQISNTSRYNYRTCVNYFVYGLKENNFLNHGILGARAYNKKFIQIYRCACCDKIRESPQELVDFKHFLLHERFFSNAVLHVNKYISSVINDHNIWKSSKNTEKIYHKYLLDELINDRFNKISYTNNPLLYILCIADTIEPIKALNNNHELIIHEFFIEVKEKQLCITVSDSLKQSNEWVNYKKRLFDLNDWIDINVFIENDIITVEL